MSTMDISKIETVLSDISFVEKLATLETIEEVQLAFKEKGLNLSIDDVNKLHDIISHVANYSGQLSEEALEEVAGGLTPAAEYAVFEVVYSVFKQIAKVVAWGNKITAARW